MNHAHRSSTALLSLATVVIVTLTISGSAIGDDTIDGTTGPGGDAEATSDTETAPAVADTARPEPPASDRQDAADAADEVEAERPAAAGGPVGWRPHGSLFTRWETRRGYSLEGADASDYVRYRARVGAANPRVVAGEGVHAGVRFTAQSAGMHGIGGDTLEQPALGLHEATINIGRGIHELQAGRFEMSYGEEVIIGAVGWHPLGRAFDGARWRMRPDEAPEIDVFATTLQEGARLGLPGTPLGAGDHLFTGVYNMFAPLLPGDFEFDAYALQRIRPATDVAADRDPDAGAEPEDAGLERLPGAVEWTFGARLKGSVDILDARAEGGTQQGHRVTNHGRRSVSAWHALAELGVRPSDTLPRAAVQVFHASGDDPASTTDNAWQTPFATGHRWLGWTDIAGGRTNIQGIAGHLSHTPLPQLGLTADIHRFIRPVGAGGDSSGFGTEVNAGMAWTLARGLVLRGAWGTFLPDSSTFGDDTDPRHFAEVELRLTF